MIPLLIEEDRQLTPAEIANITGIEGEDRYRAQANQLEKAGIKCHINARRKVVVFKSWLVMAGLPPAMQVPALAMHVSAAATKSVPKPVRQEIKLNLDALDKD